MQKIGTNNRRTFNDPHEGKRRNDVGLRTRTQIHGSAINLFSTKCSGGPVNQ